MEYLAFDIKAVIPINSGFAFRRGFEKALLLCIHDHGSMF